MGLTREFAGKSASDCCMLLMAKRNAPCTLAAIRLTFRSEMWGTPWAVG